MKKSKTQKGITLVALIITIIVLLILAVVAIRAVQGDGIIAHAKNARDNYNQAQIEENGTLADYLTKIEDNIPGGSSSGGGNAITIAEAQTDAMLTKTTNSKTNDVYGNPITVPAGFKILVDSTTGYTAEDINVTKGIVIQDGSGNEFVWIPVGKIYTDTNRTEANAKTVTLGRYSWSGSIGTLEQPKSETGKTAADEVAITSGSYNYTEKQPTSTTTRVKARNINYFYNGSIANGGYYLGRYEASASGSTIACKANQDAYVNMTQSTASDKAKAMYADGYSSGTFSSDLVNSYAWDTAIIFIQTFGTEIDASSYAWKNKSTSFAKTGVNPDKYCNIHDLSGNAEEYTTEATGNASFPCSLRGGHYGNTSTRTSTRSLTDASSSETGFRPLLYVALNV